MKHNMSRILMLIAMALAFTLAIRPTSASANAGGSWSGGGSGGSVDGVWSYLNWDDQGGVYGDSSRNPIQGWDGASITYFWNEMKGWLSGHGYSFRTDTGTSTGMSPEQEFRAVAERALQKARSRSGLSHARVVGVGAKVYYSTALGGMGFVHDDSVHYSFSDIVPRTGNASELTTAGGWSNIKSGTSQTWRDYVYGVARSDVGGANVSLVVIAVAQNEPEAFGYVTLNKASSDAAWTSSFPSIYSLSGATYNVADSTGKSVGTLTTTANGSTNTLELLPGTYKVKETKPSPGFALDPNEYTVTVTSGKTQTVSSKEAPQRGGISLSKVDSEL